MKKLSLPSFLFVISIGIYIILVQLNCEKSECEPETTRCAANITQICNSDGFWDDVIDCKKVEDTWICCWTDEIEAHTCLPPEECNDR